MNKFKKGDIVGRISYHKDILFRIKKIVTLANGKKHAILKGITWRIEADSPIEDLELIEKQEIEKNERTIDEKLEGRIQNCLKHPKDCFCFIKRGLSSRNDEKREVIYTGRILHIDGDSKYSQKSARYYRDMGLQAIVRNISESKQPIQIRKLLERYRPDILVITGHDRYDKKGNCL